MTERGVEGIPGASVSREPTGLAWQSLGLLVAGVVGNTGFFVSSLVIARSLGPTGRGTIAFFIVSVLVGTRLVSLGIAEATAVAAGRYPDRRPAVLAQAVVLSIALAIGGGAVAVTVLNLATAWRPQNIDSTMIMLIGIGIVVTTVSAAANGFLRGCARFRAYGGVMALAPWLYALCLGLLWARHELDIKSVAVVWLVAGGSNAMAALILATRVAGLSKLEPRLIWESMGFGIRAWAGSLAGMVNARIDQVIMGFITTEMILGFYSVAVNVSEVLLYLPQAIGSALLPAMLQRASEDRVAETVAVFRRLSVVTTAAAIAIAAVGAPLIPIVFGHAFRSSVAPFLLLLPSALGYGALLVAEAGLLAVGAPAEASLATVLAVVMGVVLDFVLVPPHGANGASIAASASWLTGGLVGIALLRRRGKTRWRNLIPGRNDIVAIVAAARSTMHSLAAMRS